MKLIFLTKGYFAQVDDEDFDYLNQWKWCVQDTQKVKYAIRTENAKTIRMHSLLMNVKGIDHADGNGLNNQKYNLRLASRTQNAANIKKRKNQSSQYKGVCWEKERNKWLAYIMINQKSKKLGRFDNELDAAKAYDVKAKELFGEFAKTNF